MVLQRAVRCHRFSHVRLLATPWTAARQAPLSMGFPRQEYWSGLPFPSPGDLPDPGTELESLHWQVDSLPLSLQGSPGEEHSRSNSVWEGPGCKHSTYMSVSEHEKEEVEGIQLTKLKDQDAGTIF